MTRELGVGVLGCGVIARTQHLPNLRRLRGARLVAVADRDSEIRRQVARHFATQAVASAEELVAHPGVDALVIATPTALHAEHAALAAAAGKPFYLEKPLAADAASARRLLAAAAAAGTAGCVGFHLRFQPLYRRARTLLRAGVVGEPRAVRTCFAEPLSPHGAGWRGERTSGGGVWLDLASHHFDLVRWLLDDELAAVAAASAAPTAAGGGHSGETASVTLTTRGGVAVDGLFLFGAGPLDRVEVVGTRGTLTVDRHAATLRCSAPRAGGRYGARRRPLVPTAEQLALRLRRLAQPSWEPAFARALAAFVDRARRIASPRAVQLATLADGAASLAAVLAAEAAAREGSAIAVETLEA